MSVHAPSLPNLSSLETPISASRGLVSSVAKAADNIGGSIADTVADGVGSVTDAASGLLPRRRRSSGIARLAAVGLAVIAIVAVLSAVRRMRGDSVDRDAPADADADAGAGQAAERDRTADLEYVPAAD